MVELSPCIGALRPPTFVIYNRLCPVVKSGVSSEAPCGGSSDGSWPKTATDVGAKAANTVMPLAMPQRRHSNRRYLRVMF
jgi:hypothetical protein